MSLGEGGPAHPGARGRGLTSLAWGLLLNGVLVAAFVVGAIPIVAIVRGFVDLVRESQIKSGTDWFAYGFAFAGLFLGSSSARSSSRTRSSTT